MIVILMGVSGCGKTTVGRLLASAMPAEFVDADDFHSPENVEKMRAGLPLTDADRTGWLDRLRAEIVSHLMQQRPMVLACSALRQSYRDHLARPGEPIVFVYLRGSFELIHQRMSGRAGHFMPASLLRSQFATLEEPSDAIVVEADLPPGVAVADILRHFEERQPRV